MTFNRTSVIATVSIIHEFVHRRVVELDTQA